MPLAADVGHDLDAMAAAVDERTRLVIVCNPNNPTGVYRAAGRDRALPGRAAGGPRGPRRRGLLRLRRPPRRRAHDVDGPRAPEPAGDRARSARRTASAACASATAWAAGVGRRDRPGAPALQHQRPRPGRRAREPAPPARRWTGACGRWSASVPGWHRRLRKRAGPLPPARANFILVAAGLRSGRRISGCPRAAPAPRRDRPRRRGARVSRASPGLDRDPGGERRIPVGAGAARPRRPPARANQDGRRP